MLRPSSLTTFHVHLFLFISPNYYSHKVVKVINKFTSISVNLTRLIKENAKKESKARPITGTTEDTIFLVISNPSLYMIHYHIFGLTSLLLFTYSYFFFYRQKRIIHENNNFEINIYVYTDINDNYSFLLIFILVLILIISFLRDRTVYLRKANLSILEGCCYAYYSSNSSREQEYEHHQGTRCFLFFDNDCCTFP